MSFLYNIPEDLQKKKLNRAQNLLKERGIDALIVFDSHSVRYLTNFFVKGYRTISMDYEYLAILTQSGEPILGYRSGSDEFLISARCPTSEAYKLPSRFKWADFICDRLEDRKLNNGTIATDMMPFDVSLKLKKLLPKVEIELADIWMELTSIKFDEEIELIRKAVKVASKGMETAIKTVRPGVRELDVAIEAEYAIRKAGSEVIPIITQIASGPNSAIFERISTDRIIKQGDLVIMDMGAVVGGYLSEFARTVIVGEPTAMQKEIAKIQMEALNEAKKMVRPGVKCSEVDRKARSVFIDKGYGKYMHRFDTGHQLGYGLHGEPAISKDSTSLIQKNMVLNLEPKIYLFDQPEVGGVVNEDTLLVTNDGSEQMTNIPYDEKLID